VSIKASDDLLTSWAEPALRPVINTEIVLHRYSIVHQGQMRGLVMVVVCSRQGDRREEVKGNLAIGLRVFNGLTLFGRLEMGVVCP